MYRCTRIDVDLANAQRLPEHAGSAQLAAMIRVHPAARSVWTRSPQDDGLGELLEPTWTAIANRTAIMATASGPGRNERRSRPRRARQLLDGAFLHDAAVAHQDGPAGEERGFRQIVRDQHHGLRQPREASRRSCCRSKRVIGSSAPSGSSSSNTSDRASGPHQAHPLGLPSRELAGQAAQGVQRQARDRGQLLHPRRDAPSSQRSQRATTATSPRGKMRKEPSALHHVTDLPADRRQPVARQGRPRKLTWPESGHTSRSASAAAWTFRPARSDQRRGAARVTVRSMGPSAPRRHTASSPTLLRRPLPRGRNVTARKRGRAPRGRAHPRRSLDGLLE